MATGTDGAATAGVQAPELFKLPRKAHPLQFKDDPEARTCDEKVDVWAVGVLVFELVYGKAPFAAKMPLLTCNNIMRGFSGTFPDATVRASARCFTCKARPPLSGRCALLCGAAERQKTRPSRCMSTAAVPAE